MRLLFVTHRFLPRYMAGTEVYAAALAQALAQRGHTLQVFTGAPDARQPYQAEWQGLPVMAVPWGVGPWPGPVATFAAGFVNPAAERRFAALCRAFQPEAVHIHHLLGLSSRLPAIARRAGARVVITLHDYWYVCSNTWLFRTDRSLCPGPAAGHACVTCALHRLGREPQPLATHALAPIFRARTRALRRALRQADVLIAPSQVVADRYGALAAPGRRILVVPHGLTPDGAELSPPAPPAPRRRFVYVGSLTPPKGVHVAIQAFNRLAAGEAEFHVYGSLADDPAYVAELRALAAHPGIELRGPLARERLDETLRAADVVVIPSLWDEPYSLIMDESMRASVPVLVSDRGAPSERVTPLVNGLVAPAGDVNAWSDQMRLLVQDPDLLKRLKQGAALPKRIGQHAAELERLYSDNPGVPES